eukprot:TRINITY_DN48412_c0_g1_i1.p1 TRINITY_DN48412_c0_g1~~TRINITY_DN48412_c0_g1_i1.p1  ORF type:complete len:395 (+),score=57.29 TRINITY_DN48412_c0_g1_i1:73-1185(+)
MDASMAARGNVTRRGFTTTTAAPSGTDDGAQAAGWRRNDVGTWSTVDVRAFLDAVLPGHDCIDRLGHMGGQVLGSMSKEDLRRHARDEEATNVIWAELNRLREARQEHDDIRAHGAAPFTLFVRTPLDVAVEIEVVPIDTVLDVKERVSKIEGTAVDMQRLTWNGVPMLDSRTLASYSLTHGSIVLLVPRLAATSHRYAPPPPMATAGRRGMDPTTARAAGWRSNGGGSGCGSDGGARDLGTSRASSGLPRPKVPVVCNDIARPFPMSLEFSNIPEYQAFMLAIQRQVGKRHIPSARVEDHEQAPFLEILPADNAHGAVQTRILFDEDAEVLLIDTVGDIVMECTRYQVLLHLFDDQKMATLVTGMLAER